MHFKTIPKAKSTFYSLLIPLIDLTFQDITLLKNNFANPMLPQRDLKIYIHKMPELLVFTKSIFMLFSVEKGNIFQSYLAD